MAVHPEVNAMAVAQAIEEASNKLDLAMEWLIVTEIPPNHWTNVARAVQNVERKLKELELRLSGILQ